MISNALVKLDLSHNALPSLAHGSLDGLLNLMELDISWNALKYLESRVFFHMKRLRILLLQHCQLDAVPDIVLPNTQTLDILDMSSGGVIDLGCLSLRVAVFNLTNTINYVITKITTGNVGRTLITSFLIKQVCAVLISSKTDVMEVGQ